MPSERRKRPVDKSSPLTDPDPPVPSVPKRHKPASKSTSSTQRRPVELAPKPTSSTQRRPVESPPDSVSAARSSRDSGAPLDDSTLSDLELQRATTSMSTLNMGAPVNPQGGPGLRYDQYGPIATSIPGSIHPDAFSSGYRSYDQPERSRTYHSAQYGQSRTYQSAPHGQSGTNPYAGHDQYGQNAGAIPSGTWPDDQYRQHNAPQSEQARFYQNPIVPSPYPNNPPATGMGTASAAPIDYQPETGGSTTSLLGKREPDWSDKEDKELVYLKRQYYGYSNAKTLIGQGMHRAGFTNRTEDACNRRWDRKLKAETPNLKPKDWSEKEDKRLIQLVTHFPNWNTHNGWLEVSEHMSPRREPEPCRDRWHKVLRGPANWGDWTRDEENFLVDLDSKNYGIFEIVDLLERDLLSIRDPEYTRQNVLRLRRRTQPLMSTQGHEVNWGPAENDTLINFHKGPGKISHASAAAHLNTAFQTNIFAPLECEKHWKSAKLQRYIKERQQRG